MRRVTIKQLVRRKKLTTREIGKRLDVSQPTVSRWISGDRVPNMQHLFKLARLFRYPVERIQLGRNSHKKGVTG